LKRRHSGGIFAAVCGRNEKGVSRRPRCFAFLIPIFILSSWMVSLYQLFGFFIAVGMSILGGFLVGLRG
jgi:flagellar biosynthesis protein FliQ